MSVNLIVRVHAPLETSSLIEDTQKVLEELFNLRQVFSTEGKMWGEDSANHPPFLWLKSGLMTISINGDHPILLMIINLSDDDSLEINPEAEIYADLEAKGTGGDPSRIVTAAACAIAIAKKANSSIEDEALAWGRQSQYEPSQLLEQLRCRNEHDQIDKAIEEVLVNIEQAKSST